MPDVNSYENHLRMRLSLLHDEYMEKAKPSVDELAKIEAGKPIPPVVLSKDLSDRIRAILPKEVFDSYIIPPSKGSADED